MNPANTPWLLLCSCFAFTSLFVPRLYGGVPQSWLSISPTNKNLTAVTYGQGQFVAVGWGNVTLKSPDGFQWSQALLLGGPPGGGEQDHFFAAAYGNGVFVGAGQQNMLLATSADAVNWTNRGTIGTEHIYGLTFANGHFVGVGYGALRPIYIISSTDGLNWSSPASYPTSNTLLAVTYGNGLYVAVGESGTIVRSSDLVTWTVCNSGTTKTLRAITYTGTRFLAGGDSATMLRSVDGLSWTPSPASSFDVRGLASGNGAVVAVGVYNGMGRLHASPDGLGWPGDATAASQPLNGVGFVNDRFIALGNNGLIMESDVPAAGPGAATNFWTKPTSGYWEEPFWSVGDLPSHAQPAIVFNNPGFKALAIGTNATTRYTNSLWIQNLLVDAPAGSANQLLLNFAQLNVPLRIDQDLRVGTNASLVNHFSALQAGNFYLDGAATITDFGQVSIGGRLQVGTNGSNAGLHVESGSLSAAQLVLSSEGASGTLNQSGGTLQLGSAVMNGGAVYNLSNGVAAAATFSVNADGGSGLAQVNMLGGSFDVSDLIRFGIVGFGTAGSGEMAQSGGTLRSAGLSIFLGQFRQSGGTNRSGDISVPHDSNQGIGSASYILSGGVVASSNVSVGATSPFGATSNNGLFDHSGGVHSNSVGITLWGDLRHAQSYTAGRYRFSNGTLISPLLRAYIGAFEQSGGTSRLGNISVEVAGSFFVSGGSIQSSNVSITGFGTPTSFSYLRSIFHQTGGSHVVENQFVTGQGGIAQLEAGSFTVPNITVGPYGDFRLAGAQVTNSTTFTILGQSLVRITGNYPRLGKLSVTSGNSVLDLQGASTTIRFLDCHDTAWDSILVVTNWSGSTNGGGTDQLFVGSTAQGLTAAQLAQIRFANPAGFQMGNYSARILATGEVVPAAPPMINFTRSSNGIVVSWNGNFQLLTSTNVIGPYTVISGASSPFTNAFNEPQRFFELQAQ
jgi:hypothetical protein